MLLVLALLVETSLGILIPLGTQWASRAREVVLGQRCEQRLTGVTSVLNKLMDVESTN